MKAPQLRGFLVVSVVLISMLCLSKARFVVTAYAEVTSLIIYTKHLYTMYIDLRRYDGL